MKNIYERPELKAVCFSNEDIVTASGETDTLADQTYNALEHGGSLSIKDRNAEVEKIMKIVF